MHVNWKNSFESCLLRKCSTLNHDATSAVTKGRAWKLVLSMASLASWISCCLIVLFADLSDSFTENRKCRFWVAIQTKKGQPFLFKEFSLSVGMILLAIRPMAYCLVLRETDINQLCWPHIGSSTPLPYKTLPKNKYNINN